MKENAGEVRWCDLEPGTVLRGIHGENQFLAVTVSTSNVYDSPTDGLVTYVIWPTWAPGGPTAIEMKQYTRNGNEEVVAPSHWTVVARP